MITLLKKEGKHVWEELDYRTITLTRILANRDLIGLEQNYDVKGRSTQNYQLLVREIIETIEDNTEAKPINLDQSKFFRWGGLPVFGDGFGVGLIQIKDPQMD